jgi:diguanylate cyclase (GGDEF)-like protein/PAS domain S-box-containing protein
MSQIRTDLGGIEQRIKAFLPTISERQAAQREAVALSNALVTYLAGIDEALRLSSEFEKESAFELLTQVESKHLTVIQMSMQTLIRLAFEDIASSRENLITAANRNLQMTIAIGILGGALLLGVAFLVSRRASRRITDLLRWSQRIADGDLSNHLVSDAGDEVGQLTNAMRGMVENVAHGREDLEKARKDAEMVAEELRQYAKAFDSSGEAMLISDRFNRIININTAFSTQTGYSLDEVLGKDPKMLSSNKTPRSVYEDMWRCLQDSGYWQGELWDRKKSGEVYPKWASISAIRDANQAVLFYVASFSDISERKANEARIDYLAHHDPLTGLINRYNLENRLDQALLSAHRDGLRVAVMFIDMDRFKTINDTLGHHIGDLLLIEVARRLRDSVRESDIVARLGGDEFIVVLTRMTDAMDAAPIADKILRSLAHPYSVEGKELHSSPSIGIAIYPGDGGDGPTLMKNADTAMYRAKEAGRNNYQFYLADMNARSLERLAMETSMRAAIEQRQFELHYQPQIDVENGNIIGAEVLIRWNHPALGRVSPAHFIPLAEESGLIQPIGEWVLRTACAQAARWQQDGLAPFLVSVNVSARQFRNAGFVEVVADALRESGLSPAYLELELTESVLMGHTDRNIAILQQLKEMGLTIAIDDFGTGYSSLSYLKRLPIDTLKVDRSFVGDLPGDKDDAAIVDAVISMAHSLSLKVIAEGVETEQQVAFLRSRQCYLMQGYYFHMPLPVAEFTQLLSAGL